jgi:hypothetical protein
MELEKKNSVSSSDERISRIQEATNETINDIVEGIESHPVSPNKIQNNASAFSFSDFVWEVLLGYTPEFPSPTEKKEKRSKDDFETFNDKRPLDKQETTPLPADNGTYIRFSDYLTSNLNPLFYENPISDSISEDSVDLKNVASNIFEEDHVKLEIFNIEGERIEDFSEIILNEKMAEKIHKVLPTMLRSCSTKMSLIFSMALHGYSMKTLFDNLEKFCRKYAHGVSGSLQTILIIKDTSKKIFGGFASEMWRKSSGSGTASELRQSLKSGIQSGTSLLIGATRRSYYGTGSCFLYSFDKEGNLSHYPWSGKNDYFMLSEIDFLAFGGGNGKFSLYVDGNLDGGSSSFTQTFENPPLCGDGVKTEFNIISLEMWGFII